MFFFLFDEDKTSTGPYTSPFDSIKQLDNEGNEFWYARDLQGILEYSEWRNFSKVVEKAKVTCESSSNTVSVHFVDVNKMIEIGNNTLREVDDIKLTKYACYLIAMNGDPRKEVIALAQTYFAVKTHERETLELYDKDIKRLEARDQLKESEKRLSQNIYERGVDNKGFARIRSKGDTALFGGHSTKAMKDKLGVNPARPLADFLPTVTIAAKNLATEMTNYNVEQNNMYGEEPISDEHVQNNSTIREMLAERGIKPEELPAEKDLKKVERKINKRLKPIDNKSIENA
ncbi:DNA damage-inducible protein D [Veillonella sp. AS16]|uniref:DNA damage-inducible protein D n=1 Tax=Veillonella sp. AS16 TaxID=936589 RepID=UPI0003E29BC4|nr:DNA damage-inducible protein D [Veillonella sp. AS16]ETS91629.1 BRO family, N-terminal domain protein [Veillonella sp. AS16]